MTRVFLAEGYTDRPIPGTRAALVAERNRVSLTWQDPADKELRAKLERLEVEFCAELDRRVTSFAARWRQERAPR
jgi:hypothetical protein